MSNKGDDFTPFPHFATDAIHAGQDPEQWKSNAVIPHISLSTTFKQDGPGEHRGYEYSRSGNPTRDVAEKCIASLENGKYGFLFSSGLSATTTACHMLSAGDHVIAMNDLYGGTNRYFSQILHRMSIRTTFVDARNVEEVEKAIQPQTKLIWVETPTNPLMRLVDIQAVCSLAKNHSNIITVVDNTFMSSYFQRPLDLGADIVMHSCTKYLNGHSDVVMGALVTSNDKVAEQLRFLQNAIGTVPSPSDCYLFNRGLKTLHLRMKAHMSNGLAVAKALQANPRVEKVLHPGLASHPQHELAKKQMIGFSGMVSFYIKGGLQEASTFLKSLKVITLAESLGGFESLAELPSIMTHSSVPKDKRDILGITDNFIRLAIGVEDENDIVNDIENALKCAVPLN